MQLWNWSLLFWDVACKNIAGVDVGWEAKTNLGTDEWKEKLLEVAVVSVDRLLWLVVFPEICCVFCNVVVCSGLLCCSEDTCVLCSVPFSIREVLAECDSRFCSFERSRFLTRRVKDSWWLRGVFPETRLCWQLEGLDPVINALSYKKENRYVKMLNNIISIYFNKIR